MNNLLVDSSFLYVMLKPDHADFNRVMAVVRVRKGFNFIVPYVVLTEVAFLFNRERGTIDVIEFLYRLQQSDLKYEILTPADFIRMREIMMTYQDAKFDFVDCAIMALAERLTITQVCTLDERDFSIFRPKHISYLNLLS